MAVGYDELLLPVSESSSNQRSCGSSTSPPDDVNACAVKHFAWISQFAPHFAVDGSNIHVLSEPSDFYETLKVGSVFEAEHLLNFVQFIYFCKFHGISVFCQQVVQLIFCCCIICGWCI